MNPNFKFSVLASGSSGNAVYIEAGGTRILVDVGIGIRQLQSACRDISVNLDNLDAVFITHEHTDHIKGLKSLVRKRAVPIYTSEGTWRQVRSLWPTADDIQVRWIRSEGVFSLGELVVEPFAISHDAEEPLGFCFYFGEEKLVLATDLGYVSDRVKRAAQNANTMIIEANHDIELLRTGAYPWYLKRRILGDKGHLSNDSTADFLVEVINESTKAVYLAHLSQENNRPELARSAVRQALADWSKDDEERVLIHLTNPIVPTALVDVKPSTSG